MNSTPRTFPFTGDVGSVEFTTGDRALVEQVVVFGAGDEGGHLGLGDDEGAGIALDGGVLVSGGVVAERVELVQVIGQQSCARRCGRVRICGSRSGRWSWS